MSFEQEINTKVEDSQEGAGRGQPGMTLVDLLSDYRAKQDRTDVTKMDNLPSLSLQSEHRGEKPDTSSGDMSKTGNSIWQWPRPGFPHCDPGPCEPRPPKPPVDVPKPPICIPRDPKPYRS